jgi:hypothetical protein
MEFVAMNRKVNIRLTSGVYDFESSSARGKTLLVKMIKSLGDKDMVALTYNDILLGIDIDGIISRKPRLLVFDRFDMYDDKFEVLEKLKGTDIIVLVDYKTQRHFCNFDDTCWVTLTENSLEVSL